MHELLNKMSTMSTISMFTIDKKTTPGQIKKYNIYCKFHSIDSSFPITSDLINNGSPIKINHITHNAIEYKYCSKCDNWLMISMFGFGNSMWDKLARFCKKCKTQSSRKSTIEWKKKNKKYIAEYNAEYRNKAEAITARENRAKESKKQSILNKDIRDKKRIEEIYGKLIQLAKDNDGEILSPMEEYEDCYSRMRCKCKRGHEFTQQWANCNTGKWCRKCSYITTGNTIKAKNEAVKLMTSDASNFVKHRLTRAEVYKRLVEQAESKGGCVLESYDPKKGAVSKYKCKCSLNHEFEISPNNANNGKWCKLCGRFNAVNTKRANAIITAQKEGKTITSNKKKPVRTPEQRDADELARRTDAFNSAKSTVETHGYTMLSTIADYKNARDSKLKVQCANHHTFESNWNNLKKGNGCPHCNKYTAPRAAKKTTKT